MALNHNNNGTEPTAPINEIIREIHDNRDITKGILELEDGTRYEGNQRTITIPLLPHHFHTACVDIVCARISPLLRWFS